MLRWFQALLPREAGFFDLFEAHSRTLCDGGDDAPAHCAEVARLCDRTFG